MLTDEKLREKGGSRPTVRLDQASTAALKALTEHSGQGTSDLLKRLIMSEFYAVFGKSTPAKKKVIREP